ncbi:MAG TPA: protein kinase [Nitriliruptorales bacterium]|nr:protein kinase [Nitriliruptorales bacterium]
MAVLVPDPEGPLVEVGRVVADRFELRARLGRGGMAQVFRALDRTLHREVAVKVLDPGLAQQAGVVERFRREARAAARLNHPNVVQVFDTGSDGELHYIVMELIDGPSLADVIGEVGALDPDRAAEIGEAVCRALAAAHQQGLIHRDVKPANVMLTDDGRVKVADFGIARVAEATQELTQTALGSVPYVAPEQALGRPVDERTDLYSLGCLLYEALTGRLPFTAEVPVGIVHQHLHRRPEPPSSVNPAVPEALDAVVLHAMEKDPEERYPTADAMREDLSRARRGIFPLLPAAAADEATTRAIPPSVGALPAEATSPTERLAWGGTAAATPTPAAVRPDRGGEPRPGRAVALALSAVALLVAGAIAAGTVLGGRNAPHRNVTGVPETRTVRVVP